MINNAYDLYQFLIKQGGLKPYENSYDINFKESLKSEFKIKTPKELVNITVEEFLLFFFNSSEVYSVMMSDVIKMFERAQATAEDSKNNIKLDIAFDRIKDKLKIDLSRFKEKASTSQAIIQNNLPVFKDYDNIWYMEGKISEKAKKENPNFDKIFCSSLDNSQWKQFNSFEKSSNTDLNKYVRIVKLVLDKYYYTLNQYLSIGKFKLYDGDNDKDKDRVFVLEAFKDEKVECHIFNNFTLYEFCHLESDYFISATVNYLKTVINNEKYQGEVVENLKSFFSELDFIPIDDKINSFKEYLKLPIWKLRHELYSIWVMSQIIDISDDLKINTQQGKLLFAFKPTHQARLEYKEADKDLYIDLWSELRTKTSIALIGKGRSKGIQPDYTIVQGESSKADDAIVVVECKQYKKEDYSNFSKAMVDYSNVHQNAYVFLVNYGSLSSNFESKFSNQFSDNSKKSMAIGDFNPMFPNAIKEFKDNLKEKIFKELPVAARSNVSKTQIPKNLNDKIDNQGLFEFREGFQVRLTWSEAIQDLDLYLECDDLTIFYKKLKVETYGNTITFGNDLRTIPRSNPLEYETIDVQGYLKQDFRVYVCNYSKELHDIGKSKAVVEVVYNNDVYYRFECPETLSSDIWNVFEVENGILFEIKQ